MKLKSTVIAKFKQIEKKLELKEQEKSFELTLKSARLSKHADLVVKYYDVEYGTDEYYEMDTEIQDIIDQMAEGKESKKKKSEQKFDKMKFKVDPNILVALISTVGGIYATKAMINASKDDYVDDSSLKIFNLFGKRH